MTEERLGHLVFCQVLLWTILPALFWPPMRMHWRPLYFAAVFSYFRTPPSQVTARNSTSLRHMFGPEPHLKNVVRNFGVPLQNVGPKKCLFWVFFSSISRLYGEYLRNEMSNWQTVNKLSKLGWIPYILSKRVELKPADGWDLIVEFWPTLWNFHIFSFHTDVTIKPNTTQPNFVTRSKVATDENASSKIWELPSSKTWNQNFREVLRRHSFLIKHLPSSNRISTPTSGPW